jgi:hypothetical protein
MVLTRSSAKAASAAAECYDFAPTSDLYEAQDPSGNYGEPRMVWELTGYDELSGVPLYEKREW